jgi:hypothetical protein
MAVLGLCGVGYFVTQPQCWDNRDNSRSVLSEKLRLTFPSYVTKCYAQFSPSKEI